MTEPPKKKNPMSESKKLWIGFAVVGIICCCMAGVGFWGVGRLGNQMQNQSGSDPTAIARMREKIADFETPPGYRSMALSMFIYDTLYLMPESAVGPTITLMQYNSISSASREQIEQGLRQAAEQQYSQPGLSMEVVDSFETVIRGDTVTVTVSEGGFQGIVIRQWLTLFDGNNGLVIMLVQGPAETWDDQVLEKFIESIE